MMGIMIQITGVEGVDEGEREDVEGIECVCGVEIYGCTL